jgi:hypothetical protein
MADNNTEQPEIKEDFLEVDKPIPGQNFACLSFVSPEKVLEDKNMYFFHNFIKFVSQDLKNKELTQEQILKNHDSLLNISQDKLLENYETYLYNNGKELEQQFHEKNNFKTSVRGVKVRGVYNTHREASIRAKVLQRLDKNFNVYVGQVGYWLPWDPDPDQIEDNKYQNDELNEIVGKYQENEAKRDVYYTDRTRQRQQDAVAENLTRQGENPYQAEAEQEHAQTQSLSLDLDEVVQQGGKNQNGVAQSLDNSESHSSRRENFENFKK